MHNRFPSVEVIRSRITVADPNHMYAAMSGALTSAYKTAVGEYETLREYATAVLDGDEKAKVSLRAFLEIQEGIGELYENARQIEAQRHG